MDEQLTVGQVAERFGVTVRTLHHYDEIGLLHPSERSPAGYRLYTETDVERLRTVVVYRRLGFPLEEVAELLGGDADLVQHLRRQRASVTAQLAELTGLVEAIDHALEMEMTHQPLTEADKRELFGDTFADEDYETEARDRWGDSAQWEQSRRRTASYGKDQWREIMAEAAAITADALRLHSAGADPASPEAMDVAEAHRQHIDRWFYDCSPEFHPHLGDLYVADPRYVRSLLEGAGRNAHSEDVATPDDGGSAFAQWWRESFGANAARRSGTR